MKVDNWGEIETTDPYSANVKVRCAVYGKSTFFGQQGKPSPVNVLKTTPRAGMKNVVTHYISTSTKAASRSGKVCNSTLRKLEATHGLWPISANTWFCLFYSACLGKRLLWNIGSFADVIALSKPYKPSPHFASCGPIGTIGCSPPRLVNGGSCDAAHSICW